MSGHESWAIGGSKDIFLAKCRCVRQLKPARRSKTTMVSETALTLMHQVVKCIKISQFQRERENLEENVADTQIDIAALRRELARWETWGERERIKPPS